MSGFLLLRVRMSMCRNESFVLSVKAGVRQAGLLRTAAWECTPSHVLLSEAKVDVITKQEEPRTRGRAMHVL